VFPKLFKVELPESGFLKHRDGGVIHRIKGNTAFGITSRGGYLKEDCWSICFFYK
jgi:hypothetical protein